MEENADLLKRAEQLLAGLRAELNDKEQEDLRSWLSQHPERAALMEQLEQGEGLEQVLVFFNEANQTEEWAKLESQLGLREPKKMNLWPRIVAVAAAVAAVVFGVWLFNARHLDAGKDSGEARFAVDIAPGKNGATITLSNGKVIQLSDAKTGVIVGHHLKYNDGTELSSDNELNTSSGSVQMLTAATARGQTYQFTLPDSSKVWLNADSRISFPNQFSGKERKILLDGEGYFEVSKDKARPFIVAAGGQEVKVLGTHFNISSYAEEGSVKTTLLEGSVEVSTPAPRAIPGIQHVPGMRFLLVPGQQANYNGQSIKLKNVDTEGAVSWKSGYFVFSETSLEAVMRQVERWYNVDVEFENTQAKSVMLGGTALRSDKLSVILKTLESTGAVRFALVGRKVIVK